MADDDGGRDGKLLSVDHVPSCNEEAVVKRRLKSQYVCWAFSFVCKCLVMINVLSLNSHQLSNVKIQFHADYLNLDSSELGMVPKGLIIISNYNDTLNQYCLTFSCSPFYFVLNASPNSIHF